MLNWTTKFLRQFGKMASMYAPAGVDKTHGYLFPALNVTWKVLGVDKSDMDSGSRDF